MGAVAYDPKTVTIWDGFQAYFKGRGLYHHCNFTVLDDAPADLVERFRDLLLGMSSVDPEVRPLLELEGLKQWLPGRTEGYALLNAAVDRFGFVEPD